MCSNDCYFHFFKQRKKERHLYTEEFPDEEEIENTRAFSIEEQLNSPKFANDFVKIVQRDDVSVKFFQENGFTTPVLVKNKSSLAMKVPDSSFGVDDIRKLVGNNRILDVMDVSIQKDTTMTMKDWCAYWKKEPREKILNVISLEFTRTKLESLVESPAIVRSLDWVDWVWPKHLKESQTESTNSIDDMKYPKVQKYVLMSVEGCYTDFHIDFGGTSVWYHIVKGKKVFWLIPPSEKNIQMFENWVLSGKQSHIFFGDLVEQCTRVYLEAGDTFFIPSGYIHSVYTPADSLVFGGNFLHSFAIEKQLRVALAEDTTKVPSKFRYPFYIEMHWYALERYVNCLTGKSHLSCYEDGKKIPESELEKLRDPKSSLTSHHRNSHCNLMANGDDSKCRTNSDPSNQQTNGVKANIHLTQAEVNGLKAIIMWLSRLPTHKRCVPDLIVNPDALLNDAKILVDDHTSDDSSLAVTGKLALTWKVRPKNAPLTSNNSCNTSGLSLTAQLRQIKPGLYPNLHKSSSTNRNSNGSNSCVNGKSEKSESKKPLDPFVRPINSNNLNSNLYSVKPSTILNEMPSSFNELIAVTKVPTNVPSNCSLPQSASSPATATATPMPINPNAIYPFTHHVNDFASSISSGPKLSPTSPLTSCHSKSTLSTQTNPLSMKAQAAFSTQQKALDANIQLMHHHHHHLQQQQHQHHQHQHQHQHQHHHRQASSKSTALNIISDQAIQSMPLSMATSSVPTTIMTCGSQSSSGAVASASPSLAPGGGGGAAVAPGHSTKSNFTPPNKLPPKSTNESSRRRRTRCKKCAACTRADCGECHFCKDMKKFGGPGRMKQSCIARQCMSPVLPHTACCMICGRDGWEKLTTMSGTLDENQSSLMECSQCWEIVHPVCLKEKYSNINLDLGKKDDLPNSWECPKCITAAAKSVGASSSVTSSSTSGTPVTSSTSSVTSSKGKSHQHNVSKVFSETNCVSSSSVTWIGKKDSSNKGSGSRDAVESLPARKKVSGREEEEGGDG